MDRGSYIFLFFHCCRSFGEIWMPHFRAVVWFAADSLPSEPRRGLTCRTEEGSPGNLQHPGTIPASQNPEIIAVLWGGLEGGKFQAGCTASSRGHCRGGIQLSQGVHVQVSKGGGARGTLLVPGDRQEVGRRATPSTVMEVTGPLLPAWGPHRPHTTPVTSALQKGPPAL